MNNINSLQDIIRTSGKSAIGTPGGSSLSYEGLHSVINNTRESLNQHGIGANDRVGIILRNGPAMATSFLAVASAATAAPLNPAYRDQEFEFYLSDLQAKALIVEQGRDNPARDVALQLGIRIVELCQEAGTPTGDFILDFHGGKQKNKSKSAGGRDTALVLHTSGTTSRPKIVPLSQTNLCASARHIASTLSLTAADRCLNVMPLFHIHGLIAAVLASLSAGGEVICTPGFDAVKIFGWLVSSNPTWYTAVPTMHQIILQRAPRNKKIVEELKLRFIRSSSSSLPPQVMKDTERVFACPVIESYGMTEASHQMTSNLLPPAERKVGSVGVAAGPEVRLMDSSGNFVAQGNEGEIVIRGRNVTTKYENNEDANAASFVADPGAGDSWFRTGDLGKFDADGFLYIVGRLKEIINRGGEKIAPREVDDVLLEHDAVAQAVTFSIPHSKLGEDVAAAIVLHSGKDATEEAIRDFVKLRLANFKVPNKIAFVDEIPKGSTGKIQRIGLAEKLGIAHFTE